MIEENKEKLVRAPAGERFASARFLRKFSTTPIHTCTPFYLSLAPWLILTIFFTIGFYCNVQSLNASVVSMGAQILFKGKYISVVMPEELSQVTGYKGIIIAEWQKIAGHGFQGLYYGNIGICQFWLYCCDPEKQHDCEVIALVMPTFETRDNGVYRVYKWWVYEDGLPVIATEKKTEEKLLRYMGNEGYHQTFAITPFGHLLIALPSQVPPGLFGENSKGKVCWDNDKYQSLKRHEGSPAGGTDYYLILGKKMPVVYALVKVSPLEVNYWIYRNGKPILSSKKAFEELLKLPTPSFHPHLDEI